MDEEMASIMSMMLRMGGGDMSFEKRDDGSGDSLSDAKETGPKSPRIGTTRVKTAHVEAPPLGMCSYCIYHKLRVSPLFQGRKGVCGSCGTELE